MTSKILYDSRTALTMYGLASLANNGIAVSALVDNSSNKRLDCLLELNLNGTAATNAFVELRLAPSLASTTPGTFTATAATDVIALTAHGMSAGDTVRFTNSGGALPAGLNDYTRYFLVTVNTNDFKVSLTYGGSAVDITSTGSGTHTCIKDMCPSWESALPMGLVDLSVNGSTAAFSICSSTGLPMQPAYWRLLLKNRTGASLGASGSSVYVQPLTTEIL